MLGLTMTRATQAGSNERERERERGRGDAMGVFVRASFCVFMEFTTQGGPFQVLLISALLHSSPKRIEGVWKEKNQPTKAEQRKARSKEEQGKCNG
jgi:hypothetical protein